MARSALQGCEVSTPTVTPDFVEFWQTVLPSRRRRKEPRFPFCFQIQVRAMDLHDQPFAEHTNTADISKSGCRFSLQTRVRVGGFAVVSVQGEDGQLRSESAIYSVVWCRPEGDTYEVGAELVDGPNLWNIEFPDAGTGPW